MSKMTFDYRPRPYIDNKGRLDAIYNPIITIRLSAHHKLYPFDLDCYLDSGAEFNLFPADIGETLGLNIKKGIPREHIGIGNVGIKAYQHKVKMFVGRYIIKTTVDFSFDHRIPLLGGYGFFRFFKRVIFNQIEKQVELEY